MQIARNHPPTKSHHAPVRGRDDQPRTRLGQRLTTRFAVSAPVADLWAEHAGFYTEAR